MRKLLLSAVIFVLAGGCMHVDTLTVMSFNIRYGTAPDGENCWENRQDLVIKTIAAHQPLLIGLQEVLAFQGEKLQSAFPAYQYVGVGRDDGKDAGEFAPIMYVDALFEPLDGGCFWLSDQPDTPGSVGWDAALPRIATWVKLRLRVAPHTTFAVLNTHFDHRGEKAREESARLIRAWAAKQDADMIVVLGDFNSPHGAAPWRTLCDPAEGGILADAFDIALEADDGDSFHGFSGKAHRGRIDWILCSPSARVRSAEVERVSYDERYPSDHFPVVGVLETKVGPAKGE